jgi:FkbM family methyltransferase
MTSLNFLKPLPLMNKIRLGQESDGGYVIYKRLLEKTDVLISYGIDWDTGFEEHFNASTRKQVLMFDPTMLTFKILRHAYFIASLKRFKFRSAYVYLDFIIFWKRKFAKLKRQNVLFFYEGIAVKKVDKFNTFTNHINRFNLQNDRILLKIDIEGAEYEILQDKEFYKSLKKVNQIVIEFHDLKNHFRDLKKIVQHLSDDYSIGHIHINNFSECFTIYDAFQESDDIHFFDVIELTFVKTELIDPHDLSDSFISYPIRGIDFPNNPNKRDYSISFKE